MESGLEDRNNGADAMPCAQLDKYVSMESGLEDRNNPSSAWSRLVRYSSQWSPA